MSDDAASGLVTVLEDKMGATKNLVARFVQLGGKAQSSVLHDETYSKCQQAQTEVRFYPRSNLCSSHPLP
jgi:hypothetical protein